MKNRVITIILASFVLLSFTACDALRPKETPATTASETTTVSETTTEEETTTTEEETTEETTEETIASEESTVESTDTTTTKAPTKKPTKKPTKVPTKPTYVPKGWKKEKNAWGKTYKGRKIYVIVKDGHGSGDSFKAWINGKWVKVVDEGETAGDVWLYRPRNGKSSVFYYHFKE